MTLDLPQRLYKYYGPDRLDILATRLLRYSPLGAFNDPFEGRPEVTGLSTSEQTISLIDKHLPEETRRAYESLPPYVQATVPYKQVYFMAQALAQAKETEILGQLQAQMPMIMSFVSGKLDELLGVFCLSEVPDSILMWSHYGASHAGFVLEFDSKHTHFNEVKSRDDDLRRLRRVLYRDTRPSSHLDAMTTTELFLVKSAHWAYEREWRIVRALSDADTVLPGTPFPVHLFAFPSQALTGVIIGARATREVSHFISSVIASDTELQHVRIRRAVPDSTHFHLQLVDQGI